jgi:hypothetical protein
MPVRYKTKRMKDLRITRPGKRRRWKESRTTIQTRISVVAPTAMP